MEHSADLCDFEATWAERLAIDVEGLAVPVIGLRHLYQNKLACGRNKDATSTAWPVCCREKRG